MKYSNSPKISLIASLVLQSVLSMPAFSAGFQISEISPGLQGDATAGAAAAKNDVSSLFINPATLATLQENQGYLGASEVWPNVKMSDGSAIHTVNVPGVIPSSITAPVQGQTSESNAAISAFIPDAYLSWRLNDKLVAGLALVSPYGFKTAYSYDDSVLRFAAVYSAVKAVNISPALSYQINDHWAIGAGFQAQYFQARFANFNGPYTGVSAIDELTAADQPTYLKGDGWGYGYTLGVLFKPDTSTRLGVGYRSEVKEALKGHGEQYTSPGGVVPAPSPDFLFNAQTSVYSKLTTPQILTLSAAHDIDKWTLKASAQVNFWDVFDELTIDMPEAFATSSTIQAHWKNSWFGALGAEYHASPVWTFRGGVAYDETPTRDEYRDPRIPDSDRVWLTVGASYQYNKQLSIDGAYAHIFVQNQSVNVIQASGVNATSTMPLEVNQVSANYKSSVDILALALRYKFS